MFKFNVQIKIANKKKNILLKDFTHTTTPDISLVRYPVIDSAQITTAGNAEFDNYENLCLGNNKVSLVSVLTGVRIKRVNLEKEDKEYMNFSSGQTKLPVIHGCPY